MKKNTTIKAAKDRPLTYKQKEFVRELIDNPKQSATQAALKAYSSGDKQPTYQSARVIAHENLTKPNIISKLAQYSDQVESAIMNTMLDWKDEDSPRKREIAMDMAKYTHDKIHGKATQRIEQKTEAVVISIDLSTGVNEDN